MFSRLSNNGTWTLAPTATDPGLGVRRVRLSVPTVGTTGTPSTPASADRLTGCSGIKSSPCPASYTVPAASAFTVKADGGTGTVVNNQRLPEGQVTLTTTASDALAGTGLYRPPFHRDRSPSMHAYETAADGWYCFSCRTGGSVYKLLDAAQQRWRRFNGHELVTEVLDDVKFKDGIKVTDDDITHDNDEMTEEKVAA